MNQSIKLRPRFQKGRCPVKRILMTLVHLGTENFRYRDARRARKGSLGAIADPSGFKGFRSLPSGLSRGRQRALPALRGRAPLPPGPVSWKPSELILSMPHKSRKGEL